MKKQKTRWMAAALCAWACSAVAWAGPMAGWERDMAESRRPEMPGERTLAEWRSSRSMMERSANAIWAGCSDVANGALAASGGALPSGADWKTAYSTPEERVEITEFRDGAGRMNRMAVYEQLETQVPYYWTVEGGNAAEVSATAGEVWEVEGVLSRAEVGMDELGEEVVPPYERFRFRFLDDAPEQDWIRPCRYVFEDADGSGTTVLWRKMPPRLTNRATGEKIPWKGEQNLTEDDGRQLLQDATAGVRAWQQGLLKEAAGTEIRDSNTANGGKTYFVLFSGGVNPELNIIRFWCDTAMLYSTLRLKYGVPPERIYTFVSDGNDPGADANLAGGRSKVLVNSPQDLDGDGKGDIDGAATAKMLSSCLQALSRHLKPEDQLWVFITSHGAPIGEGAANNKSARAYGWAKDKYDRFSDADFAGWISAFKCPVAVALEPCFSGGFVDDLMTQADRAVATAASNYESSFGMPGGGCWSDASPAAGKKGTPGKTCAANFWAQEFIAALRGVRPANLDYVAFPWQDGTKTVDADSNKDGRVSFREAAAWAQANDSFACKRTTHTWTGANPCLKVCNSTQDNDVEHPQYAESRSGLGNGLFAGGLSRNSAALPAGGGTAAWEREMAETRRPALPGEKTLAEWRQSRGMAQRSENAVRLDCAVVANKAMEKCGTPLPAETEWRTAFASPEERVEVAQFRDGAGRMNRLAVYEQLGLQVPYYWTVEGGNAADAAASAPEVRETEGVLTRSGIEMTELGEEVVPPYERFRFRFLDDAPEQDWIRPCRYLFEDADGQGYTVLWKKLPPQMRDRATGEEIRWKGETVVDVPPEEAKAMLGQAMSEAWTSMSGSDAGNWAEENADGGKTYFVLFSGGATIRDNDIHFWCNTAMLYSTLTKTYHVPRERISLFVSDGTSTNVDANLAGGSHGKLLVRVDSPRDLDGDGTEDVDGPATAEALSGCLARLARTLKPEDRLWIFISSHGRYDSLVAAPAFKSSSFCAWALKDTPEMYISDGTFAKWTAPIRCPVAVAIQSCYSGGFVDDMAGQPNRAIATAAHHYESAWGLAGPGLWSDGIQGVKFGTPGKTSAASFWSAEFISALRQKRPANLKEGGFPWHDGQTAVPADANRDGKVSFEEAARWAQQHDPNACPQCKPSGGMCKSKSNEHPQYAESQRGVGASIFPVTPAPAPAGNGGVDGSDQPVPFKLPIPKGAFKQQ